MPMSGQGPALHLCHILSLFGQGPALPLPSFVSVRARASLALTILLLIPPLISKSGERNGLLYAYAALARSSHRCLVCYFALWFQEIARLDPLYWQNCCRV